VPVNRLTNFYSFADESRLYSTPTSPRQLFVTPSPKDLASELSSRIVSARGLKVLLDSDLAALYGVSTMRLNEAIKRNESRFPADFCFRLSEQELGNLISQFAISSLRPARHGGRRKPPRVFTEHGAIMAATVLNSERAIQMSVFVVRAFVEMKKSFDATARVTRRLEALERSVAALDADTRKQFDQVYEAILGLMNPAVKKQ
jgi:hypothetical protein